MSRANNFCGAGLIARTKKQVSPQPFSWNFRWTPVCASTELGLSKWLLEKPLLQGQARVFLSGHQRFGRGQRGRLWESPKGGVWLSAALPWSAQQSSAGLFGLTVALAMSERLEALGVPIRIKWPNDLVVGNRKLGGLLPSLVHRGSKVRFARIGFGLNVRNPVPLEGIRLLEIIGSGKARLGFWTNEVLIALDRAITYADQSIWICEQVKKRLWTNNLKDPVTKEFLKIEGIEEDGALRLLKGSERIIWRRWS